MPLVKKKKEQKAVQKQIKSKTKTVKNSQISKVKARGRPSKPKPSEIQQPKMYIEQSKRKLK